MNKGEHKFIERRNDLKKEEGGQGQSCQIKQNYAIFAEFSSFSRMVEEFYEMSKINRI